MQEKDIPGFCPFLRARTALLEVPQVSVAGTGFCASPSTSPSEGSGSPALGFRESPRFAPRAGGAQLLRDTRTQFGGHSVSR